MPLNIGKLPEIAVIDTHTLLWWFNGDMRELGRRARVFCDRVDEGKSVAVFPSIVLVELSEALHAGRFTLSERFELLCTRLESTPARYLVQPLTVSIVSRSHDLYSVPERGDRLIAATGLELDLPVVTRDEEIGRVVRRVW